MIRALLTLHPMLLKATGMAIVAVVLLGSSFAFGLFDSNYDLNGPYDQLYPAASPARPAR